jgi:hypothetical protein
MNKLKAKLSRFQEKHDFPVWFTLNEIGSTKFVYLFPRTRISMFGVSNWGILSSAMVFAVSWVKFEKLNCSHHLHRLFQSSTVIFSLPPPLRDLCVVSWNVLG